MPVSSTPERKEHMPDMEDTASKLESLKQQVLLDIVKGKVGTLEKISLDTKPSKLDKAGQEGMIDLHKALLAVVIHTKRKRLNISTPQAFATSIDSLTTDSGIDMRLVALAKKFYGTKSTNLELFKNIFGDWGALVTKLEQAEKDATSGKTEDKSSSNTEKKEETTDTSNDSTGAKKPGILDIIKGFFSSSTEEGARDKAFGSIFGIAGALFTFKGLKEGRAFPIIGGLASLLFGSQAFLGKDGIGKMMKGLEDKTDWRGEEKEEDKKEEEQPAETTG